MVAASSDQHESKWAAIGEVAPLLLATGTPKALDLRIHTALIPRLSSGIGPWLRRAKAADLR